MIEAASMTANADRLEQLRDDLVVAAASLEGVTRGGMSGCAAAFRDGVIFGLIWKDGRIGLKFPDSEAFNARMSIEGSSPWAPRGGAGSRHWVILPPTVAEDDAMLSEWVFEAHPECGTGDR